LNLRRHSRCAALLAAQLLCWASATHAEDDIGVALINHFESAAMYGALNVQGVAISSHEDLARFYADRRFEPIWVSPQGENRPAARLRQAIAEGVIHGLAAERYHLAAADAAAAAGAWGDEELLLSQAFLDQARHRALGVVDPGRVDPNWLVQRTSIDDIELLESVARGGNPIRVLNRLWPRAREYWRLLQAKRQLLSDNSAAEPPPIPPGRTLKRGMDDARVPALRARLTGSTDTGTVYDSDLAAAVIAFQRSVGIEPDGVLGPDTLQMLNLSRQDRLRRADVNLERWRWLHDAFPATYVLVNIADFRLLAVRRRHTALDMPVIVGRRYRQTPVFTETMKYLVFNPFWDVPQTLAVQDELAKLRADAAKMAGQGFDAAPKAGGPMQPVDTIDWQQVSAEVFPYRLRQRPGPDNPLGRVKFMLPNEYAIYLHDTPARSLFERTKRGFSSGCIRVGDARALAEWVLQDQRERWDPQRIETAVTSGQTQTVVLDAPVPVFIVYFTAYAEPSGELVVEPDIYDRDPRIISALYQIDNVR